MRRMYSQKQIERFAEIVAKSVIESGVDIQYLFTTSIEDEEGLLVVNDQGGIQALSSSEHTGEFLGVDEHGSPDWIDMENVDLKVNTIESSEALFDQSITFSEVSGFTITPVYCKFIQWNHTLRIILSVKVTNDGESAANCPTVSSTNISLSDDIAAKIYDVDGKTMAENPLSADTNVIIRMGCASECRYNGSYSKFQPLKFVRYNKLVLIQIPRSSETPIPAGESLYLFGELSINL